MLEVHVNELRSGDVLDRAVLAKNGIVMLEAGTVLTESYIERLRKLGFARIALRSRSGAQPAAAPAGGRIAAHEADKELGLRTAEFGRIKDDPAAVRGASDSIVRFAEADETFARLLLPDEDRRRFREELRNRLREIVHTRPLAEELAVIRQTDPYMFDHSLQVTLLSNVIGLLNGFDPAKMHELTVGALLFDVGMTRLPTKLIQAKRQLSDAEKATLRKHTTFGYQVLSGIRDVPQQAARCALLHHERFNGSGYPHGLKKKEISDLAQIIGLSDVYDALTSKRHHRNPYSNHEAMEYLFAAGNYDFGMEMIQLFLRHVAAYPVSTAVLLSNGQLGVVESVNGRLAHRPVVRVIREADGTDAAVPYRIDLSQSSRLVIVRAVPEQSFVPERM